MTTVTGTFQLADDTPDRGTVTFRPWLTAVDDTPALHFVTRGPVVAHLDEFGQFSVEVTDSEDEGWRLDEPMPYVVTIATIGHREVYGAYFTGPGPVDLADAIKLDAEPDVIPLPLPGPQGPQGDQGDQGDKGDGSLVREGDVTDPPPELLEGEFLYDPLAEPDPGYSALTQDLADARYAFKSAAGASSGRLSCVVIGDSISNQSAYPGEADTPPGITTTLSSADFFTYAHITLRGRIRLLSEAGGSGERTDEILARVPDDVIALAPDLCIVQGGGNDITQGVEAATITANLEAIYDTLHAAGIRPVAATVLASDAMNTTVMRDTYVTVNDWIVRYAREHSWVVLCDWAAAYCDPATVAARPGYTTDGVHPSQAGAAAIGSVLAVALENVLHGTDGLCSTNYGSMVALNPMMLGTDGNKAAGVTGELATSWVTSWGGTEGTATVSKVERDDGLGGEWQRIELTGTGALQLFQQSMYTGTDWDIGDRLFAECEYRRQNDWDAVTDFRLLVTYYAGGGTNEALSGGIGVPMLPMSGVLRTPIGVPIPAATERIQTFIRFNGTGGTLDVSRIRVVIRKGGA